VRTIQIEQVGESYAPVLEAEKIEYGQHFLKVWTKNEAEGGLILHTFPWCNVRNTREWIEVSPRGESGENSES
jgi:hypothetical protein